MGKILMDIHLQQQVCTKSRKLNLKTDFFSFWGCTSFLNLTIYGWRSDCAAEFVIGLPLRLQGESTTEHPLKNILPTPHTNPYPNRVYVSNNIVMLIFLPCLISPVTLPFV